MSSSAARLEDAANRRIVPYLKGRGWVPEIVPFTGYGSTEFVRVLARAVMHNPARADADHTREGRLKENRRGWRNFISTHVAYLPVEITAGKRTIRTMTDRTGYVDVVIRKHGMDTGWNTVTVSAVSGDYTEVPVRIFDPNIRYGLISDIDDTVMVTNLPRPMVAAWNTFGQYTADRQPVAGMAELYRTLADRHPNMPVIYLSTGAWNVVPTLDKFLTAHNFPAGPMLMTDWGPTNTGFFRSGVEHKRTQLRRLAIEFPNIKWYLVGDDGQHDPMIYREMARHHPRNVRSVLIRQLNPREHLFAHGTIEERYHADRPVEDELDEAVPLIEASDGYGFASQLEQM